MRCLARGSVTGERGGRGNDGTNARGGSDRGAEKPLSVTGGSTGRGRDGGQKS